jgi:hypothetical protein
MGAELIKNICLVTKLRLPSKLGSFFYVFSQKKLLISEIICNEKIAYRQLIINQKAA